MKTYRIWRSETCVVIEFNFRDMVKLLLGRELKLTTQVIIDEPVILRHQAAYEAFNMRAPAAK